MRVLLSLSVLTAVVVAGFGPGVNLGAGTVSTTPLRPAPDQTPVVGSGPAYFVGGKFKPAGSWNGSGYRYLFDAFRAYGQPEMYAYYNGSSDSHKLVLVVLSADLKTKVGTTPALDFAVGSEHTVVAGTGADGTLHIYVDETEQTLDISGSGGSGAMSPMPTTLYVGTDYTGRYGLNGDIYNLCQGDGYVAVTDCIARIIPDAAAPGLDAAEPGLDAAEPGLDAAAPGLDASSGPPYIAPANEPVTQPGPTYFVGGVYTHNGSWVVGATQYLFQAYASGANQMRVTLKSDPPMVTFYGAAAGGGGGSSYGTTPDLAFTDGSTHKIVGGVDADGRMHIYADGVDQSLGAGTGGDMSTMPPTLYNGSNFSGGNLFDGTINCVCQGATYADVASCITTCWGS